MAEVAYPKNGSVKTDEEKMMSDDDDTDDGDDDTRNNPKSCVALDYPEESFRVKVEEISGWIDHSAPHEQDGSTRGRTNPKSQHRHASNFSIQHPVRSGSQRFSGPIIGLPQRLEHSGYLGRSTRRQQVRLFPKRKKGKRGVAVWEPTSPKVSCLGKVRSKRDRIAKKEQERGCTLWSWLASLNCWNGHNKKSIGEAESRRRTKADEEEKRKSKQVATAVVPVAPGLGGLKRFSSGRRAEMWPDDEVERSLGSMDDVGPAFF